MKAPRLMIAAPSSGSGKTVITCALLEAAKQQNKSPRAFKCGPDYIDPMFHKEVLGVPSANLDSFFSDAKMLKALFLQGDSDAIAHGISIVEGVMGLYDGLGGTKEEASAYDVAAKLQIPIVLVVDAHGMGRSILPLLAGFLQYDHKHLIQGVILNRTSAMFCKTIGSLIEEELGIRVLGCFPKQKELHLESRHLGLKMPNEVENRREQVKLAADILTEYVDLDALWEIAVDTPLLELENGDEAAALQTKNDMCNAGKEQDPKVRIGVAKDEAFCFYYGENLRMLEEQGAEIVYFSPLHDKELPKDIKGLLFGGGYPELYGKQLAANESMKQAIKEAIQNGMPSVAECGGFMYLHDSMVTEDGERYAMCGVIPASVSYQKKLVRFGYVQIKNAKCDTQQNTIKKDTGWKGFLPDDCMVKGHEFHYFDSTDNGADCSACKPTGNRSYGCVHSGKNYWWGFPHLYYPSCPVFAKRFVAAARRY
ncbi:MAG: cobyrinate a,c-diamide synthase [Eubacteriales bacterium]|nr:cobyrinate a,c-diamide synthase [Eubacteriales bacterium]